MGTIILFATAAFLVVFAPSKWVSATIVGNSLSEELLPEFIQLDGEQQKTLLPPMESQFATETPNQHPEVTSRPQIWNRIIFRGKKTEEDRSPMGPKMADGGNPKNDMTDNDPNQCKPCNRIVSPGAFGLLILVGSVFSMLSVCQIFLFMKYMNRGSYKLMKKVIVVSRAKTEKGTFAFKVMMIPPGKLMRIKKLPLSAPLDDIV